jgi:hypothetical protein
MLLRIRYDDLVSDLRPVLGNVLRFTDLPERPLFWNRVERHAVHDFETKWRTDLDASQRERLEKSLGQHLQKYGFAL